jgi:hypothetical protein
MQLFSPLAEMRKRFSGKAAVGFAAALSRPSNG